MGTVKNFLAPALARRSRLAGHGSPVTARRFSGEGRGGRFFHFSSFICRAVSVAGNGFPSKTSRYFCESGRFFPQTRRYFLQSNRYFPQSSRYFRESSHSFCESSRYFPSGNRHFCLIFVKNPSFLRILPQINHPGRARSPLRAAG